MITKIARGAAVAASALVGIVLLASPASAQLGGTVLAQVDPPAPGDNTALLVTAAAVTLAAGSVVVARVRARRNQGC